MPSNILFVSNLPSYTLPSKSTSATNTSSENMPSNSVSINELSTINVSINIASSDNMSSIIPSTPTITTKSTASWNTLPTEIHRMIIKNLLKSMTIHSGWDYAPETAETSVLAHLMRLSSVSYGLNIDNVQGLLKSLLPVLIAEEAEARSKAPPPPPGGHYVFPYAPIGTPYEDTVLDAKLHCAELNVAAAREALRRIKAQKSNREASAGGPQA